VKWLYQCFGISKQAYYKRINAYRLEQAQAIIILSLVKPIRERMTALGARKLHGELRKPFAEHGIKMGRDAFMGFLRARGMLVKKSKRYHITTNSKHFFHASPNRLKGLRIDHSEQVWVSDITYIKLDGQHAYLALVTDAYSKKIMGWCVETHMRADLVKSALEMALRNAEFAREHIIHHSDRGIQYCCPEFTEFAIKNGMTLSTTQKYDPYENAIAERINGILKYEFGLRKTLPNLTVARSMVREAVEIYNNERPHWGLDLEKPAVAHSLQLHVHKTYGKKAPLKQNP
jgi:putative transposase